MTETVLNPGGAPEQLVTSSVPRRRPLLLDIHAEVRGRLANNNREAVLIVVDVFLSPGGVLSRHGFTGSAQSHPAPPADRTGTRETGPGRGLLL